MLFYKARTVLQHGKRFNLATPLRWFWPTAEIKWHGITFECVLLKRWFLARFVWNRLRIKTCQELSQSIQDKGLHFECLELAGFEASYGNTFWSFFWLKVATPYILYQWLAGCYWWVLFASEGVHQRTVRSFIAVGRCCTAGEHLPKRGRWFECSNTFSREWGFKFW